MHTATQTISYEAWFDDYIRDLRVRQLSLETGTADAKTTSFFDAAMEGDLIKMSQMVREMSHSTIIKQIIFDYIALIGNLPLKLAFDLSRSEVLVWAEIKENEEELEDKLIMAEAKINAKFHNRGFDLTTMIVEENEYLSIPNHYRIFKE